MDWYMGSIIAWPISYAPRGWMFCNGQLLQISQYSALFALIGITYGGDGRQTFALPNLNGRVPVGAYMGGTGINTHHLGETGGSEGTVLTVQNLPAHNHSFSASGSALNNASANVEIPVSNNDGSTGTPGNTCNLGVATYTSRPVSIYSTNDSNANLKPFSAPVTGDVSVNGTIGNTGNNTQVNNMQPYTALNYIICVEGMFPPRP